MSQSEYDIEYYDTDDDGLYKYSVYKQKEIY